MRNFLWTLFCLILVGCEENFYSNPASKDLSPQGGGPTTQDTTDPNGGTEGDGGDDDGGGLVPYLYSESFTGNNQQKLDVLMVVDNSGSMEEEIAAVRNQLGNFIDRLQTRRAVDYQIAVTTTNFIGQTRPGASRLTASTQTGSVGETVAKSATQGALAVQIGRDIIASIPFNPAYAGLEMGIAAAMDTISNAHTQFMRDKVDLAVITISDEDDHSQPACLDPNNADCQTYAYKDAVCPADGNCPYYLNVNDAKTYFQSLSRSVMYKALVGLENPLCSTVYTLGRRYTRLAELLSFQTLDICTNVAAGQTMSPLESNLLGIADSISARGICFPMTVKATGNQIVVKMVSLATGASQNVPSDPVQGYQFDAPTNAICFPGSIVVDSSIRIDITYESLK